VAIVTVSDLDILPPTKRIAPLPSVTANLPEPVRGSNTYSSSTRELDGPTLIADPSMKRICVRPAAPVVTRSLPVIEVPMVSRRSPPPMGRDLASGMTAVVVPICSARANPADEASATTSATWLMDVRYIVLLPAALK
jgi:hypothetical protein